MKLSFPPTKTLWIILAVASLGWAILGSDGSCLRIHRGDYLLHAPNPQRPTEPGPEYHPE